MLKAKPVAKLGDIGDTRDPAAHILEGDNIAHVKETTLTRQHNAVERRELIDDIFQRHGNGPALQRSANRVPTSILPSVVLSASGLWGPTRGLCGNLRCSESSARRVSR